MENRDLIKKIVLKDNLYVCYKIKEPKCEIL